MKDSPFLASSLAAALMLCGGPAQGQPAQTAPALADTFAVVVPLRPDAEIAKDRDRAGLLLAQSKERLSRAQEEIGTLDNLVTAREKDLDALKAYLKSLDSDSAAAEIALLKEKRDLLEKVLDLVTLRKKVRESDAASAKAAIALAEAQEDFFGLEGKLLKKREDRAALLKDKGPSADLLALDTSLKAAQEDLMDRWKKMLGKQDDSLSEEQDFLKMLGKLVDAQEAFRVR